MQQLKRRTLSNPRQRSKKSLGFSSTGNQGLGMGPSFALGNADILNRISYPGLQYPRTDTFEYWKGEFCRTFDSLHYLEPVCMQGELCWPHNILKVLDGFNCYLTSMHGQDFQQTAEIKCADPSTGINPEICSYLFYKKISYMNQFFHQIFNNGFRAIFVDIWLLHPKMRPCLPILKRDLKFINAKSELAEKLSQARKSPYKDIIDGLSTGEIGQVFREMIKNECENKHGDQIFCRG